MGMPQNERKVSYRSHFWQQYLLQSLPKHWLVNEGISGIKQDIFRHGRLRKEYFAILRKTDKEEPAPEKGAKGRVKATKGRNLMIRLREHAAAVFAFALHIEVSFTNNQAERDLRPVKLKAKVSGCLATCRFLS
jgi:hypothetical protein